ncbi:MAG: dTDP-4-dehydrorhamnose 3,5-epimerase family protein [Candidatus Bathyarchaeia archaeon]
MLSGIVIKQLKRIPDERGFFTEIFRDDWQDLIQNEEIKQANLSISYPGIIRAWHKHERGQIDYFIVIKGALKICAYDETTQELAEIISTGENLQVVKIPGHYWHGFKVVSNESAMLVYLVNRLYDYNNPDELRKAWNDPSIIPKMINGKKDDSRVGKPWDWLLPPHK